MMFKVIVLLTIFVSNVFSQKSIDSSIIYKAKLFFSNAQREPVYSIERQILLDSALKYNPTEAYYWQQKSMPLNKMKKYELGMQYLDSAVKYDKTNHWREYRAFMICTFQKKIY